VSLTTQVEQTVTDNVNTITAWGGVTSPWWLPHLREASEIAGLLAPILGAAWLLTQIVIKVKDTMNNKKKE
jgi:hypothetical protein